ncbi:hypothetical protein Glove_411g24 [Diversispora epigaea]|uniref:Uncharacterized protein n=1 Tax=Diversispora epigaea TaxID=1348612 RepID=A0A397GYG7_9GLOM|nr:hypothetical protein Glove_411g24 [Diversispora epigaea]
MDTDNNESESWEQNTQSNRQHGMMMDNHIDTNNKNSCKKLQPNISEILNE